ncbi:MAG TPA: hypothetical protein VKG45_01940 [Actinomycetes bacterium]|nr:hypothetical protein [Actinomycetes bacterium]
MVNRGAVRSRAVTDRPWSAVGLLAGMVRLLAVLALLASMLLLSALVSLAAAAGRLAAAPLAAEPEGAGPPAGPLERLAADQVQARRSLEVIDRWPEPGIGGGGEPRATRPAGSPSGPVHGTRPDRDRPDGPGPPVPPLAQVVLPTRVAVAPDPPPAPAGGDGVPPGRPVTAPDLVAAAAQQPADRPAWMAPGLEKVARYPGGVQPLLYALVNRGLGGGGFALPFAYPSGLAYLAVHDAMTQHVLAARLVGLPEVATGIFMVGGTAVALEVSSRIWNEMLVQTGHRPAFPPINGLALAGSGIGLVVVEGPVKDWLERHGVLLATPVAIRNGRPVWASPGDYAKNLGYDMAAHFLATATVMGRHDYWLRTGIFQQNASARALRLAIERARAGQRRTIPFWPPATLEAVSAQLRGTWRWSPAALHRLFPDRVPAWARWPALRYGIVAGLVAAAAKGASELLWDPPPGRLGDRIRRLTRAAEELAARPSPDSLVELAASAALNSARWWGLTGLEALRNSDPLLAAQRLVLAGRIGYAAWDGDAATARRLAGDPALDLISPEVKARSELAAARARRSLREARASLLPTGPARSPGLDPAPGQDEPPDPGPPRSPEELPVAQAPAPGPTPGPESARYALRIPTRGADPPEESAWLPDGLLPGGPAPQPGEPAGVPPADSGQAGEATVLAGGTEVEPEGAREPDRASEPVRAKVGLVLPNFVVNPNGALVAREDAELGGLPVAAGTRIVLDEQDPGRSELVAADGTALGRFADLIALHAGGADGAAGRTTRETATGETGSGGQREAPTTQETTTQETLDPAARIPAAGIAMVDEGPT